MRHIKPLPPLEVLRDLFELNQNTGTLCWRLDVIGGNGAVSVPAGTSAGTLGKDGYLRVVIAGTSYSVHRICWKLDTGRDPSGVIDHADGNKLNNARGNLRDATQAQNVANSARRMDSKTGVKGVYLDRERHAYVAAIKVNGRRIQIGSLGTLESAAKAVTEMRTTVHGAFANSGD